MHRFRLVAIVSTVAVLAFGLTACGSGGGSSAGPATITIVEKDGKITPNDGHIVEVGKGKTVTLDITSDKADEIHVHSTPEHEFEIKPGHTTETFSVDSPGRFVIESHGLDITLVTLEVK